MEQTINCIAVDDDAPALRVIEQYINKLPQLKLVAKFRNPLEATNWLKTNKADVLFLDIQMQQQSGLSMLQELPIKPLTIFTTAYSEFAADAFDLDAIDYLRKPFSFDRFNRAIDKATDYLTIVLRQDTTIQQDNTAEQEYIAIKTNGVLTKLYVRDILYVEGFQEYIKIHTVEKRHVVYERMKNMEKMLPAHLFMRVHKSYIVAVKQVTTLTGNLLKIAGQEIPVSRDLKDEVLKRIF